MAHASSTAIRRSSISSRVKSSRAASPAVAVRKHRQVRAVGGHPDRHLVRRGLAVRSPVPTEPLAAVAAAVVRLLGHVCPSCTHRTRSPAVAQVARLSSATYSDYATASDTARGSEATGRRRLVTPSRAVPGRARLTCRRNLAGGRARHGAPGSQSAAQACLVSQKILLISSILPSSSSALATSVLPLVPLAPASLVASLNSGVQLRVLLEVRRLEVVGPQHPQVVLDQLGALLLDDDGAGPELRVGVAPGTSRQMAFTDSASIRA